MLERGALIACLSGNGYTRAIVNIGWPGANGYYRTASFVEGNAKENPPACTEPLDEAPRNRSQPA